MALARIGELLIHHRQTADLNLYLEDDLVISDRHYLDKIAWFQELCEHRMVLMPPYQAQSGTTASNESCSGEWRPAP